MRTTRFAATVVSGVLTLAVAATAVAAPAAKPKANAKGKAKTVAMPTCATKLTEQIPNGETTINTADTAGTDVGTVTCGKLLGTGLAWMSFTVPASGNLVGTVKQYFATGSMHGTYVLVPNNDTAPTSTTFSAETYAGTVKIAGGTGIYQTAKGTGTITCSTPDSVHMTCLEHLKLTRL